MNVKEFEGATIHFHNDADGCASAAIVCSKLENYTLKAHDNPNVTGDFSKGKHLFLDLGGLTANLVEGNDVTVLDHHKTPKLPCRHINPRFTGQSFPCSYLTWQLFGDKSTMWIAACGIIGDRGVMTAVPLFEALQEYSPDLVSGVVESESMFLSPIGRVSQMIDANSSIHGETGGEMNVRALTTLTPDEILSGKGIAKDMKNALETLHTEIETILKKPVEKRGKLILSRYKDGHKTKSAIANALSDKYPDCVVMVARESNGVVSASMRGNIIDLSTLAKQVTEGIGNGGGHPVAAGLTVPADKFDLVIERIEKELLK